MAISERLEMILSANGSQAIAEFQKTGAAAQKSLTTIDDSSQRMSRNLVRVGAGMAAFGGVMLVGLYKAAQAAEEENVAIEKLHNSIANSPELAGASADAFLDQAAALQDVTTFADDATIAAQAMLGTFHLTQSEILGLTPLVADLAAKFDMDLVQASKLVGKAMDGNAGALQRTGVRIDEAAFATDRYSAVMTALRENAGGFAEQEGATFSGRMEILKNNLGDIAEGIGTGAVDAFNSLLGPVEAVSDAFTSLSPQVQGTVGKMATFGAVGLVAVGGLSMVAGAAMKLRAAYLAMAAAQQTAAAAAAIAAAGPFAAVAAGILGIAIAADAMSSPGQAEGFVQRITEGEEDIASVAAELANLSEGVHNYGRAGALAGATNAEISEIVAGVGAIDPTKAQELADELVSLGVDADVAAAAIAAIPHMTAAEQAEAHALAEEEVAAAIDAVTQSISEYVDRVLGLGDARDSLESAFNSLWEQLMSGSHALQGNSAAAIANRDALRGIVEETSNVISQQVEEGASEEQLQQTKAASIERLYQLADTMGWTRGQIRTYVAAINGIPGSRRTNLTADNRQALTAIEEATRRGEEFARRNFTAHLSIMDTTGSQTGGMGSGDAQFNPDGTPRSRESGLNKSGSPGPARLSRRRERPQPVYVVGGMP